MKRLPRWLATLPLSLVVHASIVAAAIGLLRNESAPPALVLDLEAIVAGGAEGPGGGAPAPPRPVPRAPAAAERRALTPSAVATAPRTDAAERAVETREPVTPTLAPAAPSPVPTATPTVPPGASPAPAVSPGLSAGETTVAGVTGLGHGDAIAPTSEGGAAVGSGLPAGDRARGGAGGGVVAAIPPETSGGTGSGAGMGMGSEYGPYLARVRQLIQETLRYPPAALRRGVTGVVQLEITIAASGAISSVAVITSSSHEMLDRAAVNAARSLPRVPFPKDLRPASLTARLPIVFELR